MKKNMAIDKNAKVTLDSMVKRAARRAEIAKIPLTIYIPSLEGNVDFERPSDLEVKEAVRQINSGELESDEANAMIIYNACPLLRSDELQQQLEVKDPVKVVEKIFSPAEIAEISNKIVNHDEVEGEIEVIKN